MESAKEAEILQAMRTHHKLDSAWLGLHDQFKEGDWVSVLDEPIGKNGYIGWTPKIANLPDNYGGNQHCARLMDGGMDDIECSATFAFICEIF